MALNQFTSPEGDLDNYLVTEYWLIDQYVGDTLWGWGRNGYGQLGDNTVIQRNTPVTTLPGGTNWKQISCRFRHTTAIKTDGTLWTWGENYYGQLGTGQGYVPSSFRSTPVQTFFATTNWKQVSCGQRYTAAIKTDGTLWTWGRNNSGQLGNNTTTSRSTPVTTFVGGNNWKQVSAGYTSPMAIKTDGTLWTWGRNLFAQIGDNTTTNRLTPVTTFAGGTNWKQVSAGYSHMSAIKTDGTLWTWGRNYAGSLGDNTTTQRNTPITTFAGGTNWKQVICGQFQTVAIKTDGTLWTWGYNSSGQLGVNDAGTTFSRTTPVTTFAGGTNWKQVAGGDSYTAAIKTDGTLWTWGINTSGPLGDNTTTTRCTPVTTFAGGTNWKQVSAGYNYTLAVTSGTDPTYFIA